MIGYLIDASHQRTTQWSGGETTEIFIYPKGSDYAKRQFSWRVSSATVEKEESDFTPLYGIKRWIMPLEAPLLLKHKNQQRLLYEILLKPYEAHCFKGDWETKSVGVTRDFNLMLKEGCYGILKHFKLSNEIQVDIETIFPEIFDSRLVLVDKRFTLGFYSIKGQYEVQLGEEAFGVKANELFLVDNSSEQMDDYKTLMLTQEHMDYLDLVIFFVAYDAA